VVEGRAKGNGRRNSSDSGQLVNGKVAYSSGLAILRLCRARQCEFQWPQELPAPWVAPTGTLVDAHRGEEV
jgi:hypothetical protein